MPKKQGSHLNIGEVKSSILEFILENKGHVGEPAIRDFLLQRYDLMDQGNINRHLHELQKLNCIELIPPQKKGLSNQWDIEKIKHLKSIREEFSEIQLNKHEKAINIIILEFQRDDIYIFDWLKIYIQLLLSVSFFDTCLEIDIKTLCQRIWRSYITTKDPDKHKDINDLLKICYNVYAKHYSDYKVSEEMFTTVINEFSVEFMRFGTKTDIIKLLENLPGLPEEIPLRIIKTRLSERIEKLPAKIPDGRDDKDFVKYMLHILQLIMEKRWAYDLSIPYLLLEHFFIQDILIGVDCDDEHYFMRKKIENWKSFERWPDPYYMGLGEVELADLKLISEIIIKYKQPAQLSDLFNNIDEISMDKYRAIARFGSEF
jgi:hypothetical protein